MVLLCGKDLHRLSTAMGDAPVLAVRPRNPEEDSQQRFSSAGLSRLRRRRYAGDRRYCSGPRCGVP